MFNIKGEIYQINISHEQIDITSPYSGVEQVHIEANLPEEDFSIFDLGPGIATDIKALCKSATIGDAIYENACIHIYQKAGKYTDVTIHEARESRDVPIDSGRVVLHIKDYVVKYE